MAVIARRLTAASGAPSLKETPPRDSIPSLFQSPARSHWTGFASFAGRVRSAQNLLWPCRRRLGHAQVANWFSSHRRRRGSPAARPAGHRDCLCGGVFERPRSHKKEHRPSRCVPVATYPWLKLHKLQRQNGARREDLDGLAARPVTVDNRRHLVVRADFQELGVALIALTIVIRITL
jgi:hypothetical protein